MILHRVGVIPPHLFQNGLLGRDVKILMIEDDKPLADSVGTLLGQQGFEVECVYDGVSFKSNQRRPAEKDVPGWRFDRF